MPCEAASAADCEGGLLSVGRAHTLLLSLSLSPDKQSDVCLQYIHTSGAAAACGHAREGERGLATEDTARYCFTILVQCSTLTDVPKNTMREVEPGPALHLRCPSVHADLGSCSTERNFSAVLLLCPSASFPRETKGERKERLHHVGKRALCCCCCLGSSCVCVVCRVRSSMIHPTLTSLRNCIRRCGRS